MTFAAATSRAAKKDVKPVAGLPKVRDRPDLRAVQTPNLALLIQAQHQGTIRWIQAQAHNIAHLVDKI